MHLVAKTLLEKETLDKDEIIELLEKGKLNASSSDDEDVKVTIQGQSQASESNKLEFDKDKEIKDTKSDPTEE
ncbi:hypothetical protein D3C86_2039670 [compost metagenome]